MGRAPVLVHKTHIIYTTTHTQGRISSLPLLPGLQGHKPSAYSRTYFNARWAGVTDFKKTNKPILSSPDLGFKHRTSRLWAACANHYTAGLLCVFFIAISVNIINYHSNLTYKKYKVKDKPSCSILTKKYSTDLFNFKISICK